MISGASFGICSVFSISPVLSVLLVLFLRSSSTTSLTPEREKEVVRHADMERTKYRQQRCYGLQKMLRMQRVCIRRSSEGASGETAEVGWLRFDRKLRFDAPNA